MLLSVLMLLLGANNILLAYGQPPQQNYFMDATTVPAVPTAIPNIPATTNPRTNMTFSLDSASFRINGQPILPLAGEMHPTRVPCDSWERDLAAMKAGGLDIVDSYIIWNHIQEINITFFDWSGSRDIRRFVQTAQKVGLFVALRIGPWDHGEVRNGGFPDWVQKQFPANSRSNNTAFMSVVKVWFCGLAEQLKGMMFDEGGPVLSLQMDNETPNVAYLLALRSLSLECGLKPFAFTKTGWPQPDAPIPFGDLVPYLGAYTDLFWTNDKTEDPSWSFLFSKPDMGGFPYFTVETGGGMTSAYHRRVFVQPEDIAANAFVTLGSGANQVGFYMYHGGYNPMGQLSTLQESQENGYWDLPIRSYDFYAPIGESGQPHPQYHLIRRMAIMTRTFGSWLGTTVVVFSNNTQPSSPTDNTTLRWTARTDGTSAVVFLSNYQNFAPMNPHVGVTLHVALQGGVIVLPSVPFTLQPGIWAAWPLNITWYEKKCVLQYATAERLTSFFDGSVGVDVFFATPGIASEFMILFFPGSRGLDVVTCEGTCTPLPNGTGLLATNMRSGLGYALQLRSRDNTSEVLSILLLDDTTAARSWVMDVAGQTRLMLSDVDTSYLLNLSSGLSLITETTQGTTARQQQNLWIVPALKSLHVNGSSADIPSTPDGIFARYTIPIPPATVTAVVTPRQEAGPARIIPIGPSGVAQAPSADGSLGAFAQAGVWSISLQGVLPVPTTQLRLTVNYTGDAARVYNGSSTERSDLLFDHFYNGRLFEVPFTRTGLTLKDGVTLRILPMNMTSSPVYFESRPLAAANGIAYGLQSILVTHVFELQLIVS